MANRQHQLFETEPAAWDDDDAREQLVASVVFARGPDKPFDYLVPDSLRDFLESGRRVRAPFGRGNRAVVGYCIQLESRRGVPRRLKQISAVVDRRNLLTPAMLRLTEWLAERYLCTRGQALEAVLPAVVRDQAGNRRETVLWVPRAIKARLAELDLPPKQAAVLAHLAGCAAPITAARLAVDANTSTGPIKALRDKGYIAAESRLVPPEGTIEPPAVPTAPLELEPDQQQALDTIVSTLAGGRHATVLVHGVTGSGKTEVYIRAIEEVIRYGRQAIVLVPEISLTPQTREQFRSRFARVAVLHSLLRDSERHWHWDRIARGEVQVVVGARSAVFAPTPRLGLIVLDEEHESTFKQDSVPRYHARDVALHRASAENVPLILGSATPALESWHMARLGEYVLVEMPRRVFSRPLPAVATIDLRAEFRDRRSRGAISRPLAQAMQTALADEGQVILLLNRRGFSTHIQCPACGLVLRCPECDLALTHHRQGDVALCHYCDYHVPAPSECPECRFAGIRYSGLGTQRLEAEVNARFPLVACLRMDSDTMKTPGSHAKALAAFRAGEARILLGTQMIAKGLDFPNVTLVGVVNADTALHLPDFRAAERTFQLVTQVAGRTGRGAKGGCVLVQTFSPDHAAILAAVRHDYDLFARQELPIREALGYPPYTRMLRVVVSGPRLETTREFAAHLAGLVRSSVNQLAIDVRILGPAPAPIARLRGQHRFHLQLTAIDATHLRAAINEATTDLKPPDEVFWSVDVNPLNMM